MRARTRFLGLVMVFVGLVACGSSGSGGGSGAGSEKPSPTGTPTTPSTAQLQARLLTAADVGSGWKAGQPLNPQDLAAFAQLPCDKTVSPGVAKRLTAVTGTQFEPVDRSYKHLIELVSTGDPVQLAGDLSSLFRATEACLAAASTGPDGAKLTVKPLAMPTMGDQQAAFAVTQARPASPGTALYFRTAYVRLGGVAAMLGLADFQASAQGKSQISDETFTRLVQTAVTKLKG